MPYSSRKVSVSLLRECRPPAVDWPQLICELAQEGITNRHIGAACELDRRTVNDWKNRGTQPKHRDGETLRALHERFCKAPRERFTATIGADGEIRCG